MQNLLRLSNWADEVHNWMIKDMHMKKGFLEQLETQDDWSFVIKSHALIEAAVTNMIVEKLGESGLLEFVQRLPLSDNRTGKVTVAMKLELLEAGHRKFIKWFSELRNSLVHNFDSLNFTFPSHIDSLTSDERKKWRETIFWDKATNPHQAFFDFMISSHTKQAISTAVLGLVYHCSAQCAIARGNRDPLAFPSFLPPLDSP